MVELTQVPPATASVNFGGLLKDWRRRRGTSQLELALRSGVSQRHISFVESGRSKPSRDMVTVLAGALDVPLRHQNTLMMAAGFAPVWRESDLSAPELAEVRTAIDRMLGQQEPYPAIVIDRMWNLFDANRAAQRLTGALLQEAGAAPPQGRPNLLRMILDPRGLRPVVANWAEIAQALTQSTYAELVADGADAAALAFIEEIMAYPDVPRILKREKQERLHMPVLPVEFRLARRTVKVFTVIATLGTPQDIAVQEVRVELFFPADPESEAFFRQQSADS